MAPELKTLQFKRDGFLVTVAAADVTEVSFRCPRCGGGERGREAVRGVSADVVAGAVSTEALSWRTSPAR
jgi:hypothetical protein